LLYKYSADSKADSKAEAEGGKVVVVKAVALDKPVVERVVDSNLPEIVLYLDLVA
jgi:hypothetical protein